MSNNTPQRVLTAYITVRDAAKAIEFYKNIFGATELFRLNSPDGRIGHAELAIGGANLMLSDESPAFGALSPQTIGGSPMRFFLPVDNANKVVQRAVDGGAILMRPVADQFYGERSGMVTDPFGFSWLISSLIEEVAPEEMQRRWSSTFEEVK